MRVVRAYINIKNVYTLRKTSGMALADYEYNMKNLLAEIDTELKLHKYPEVVNTKYNKARKLMIRTLELLQDIEDIESMVY